MEQEDITLEQAVNKLCEQLQKDTDLFYGYQSNIAMEFVDACTKREKGGCYNFKEIGNEAAENFLNLLINSCKPKKNPFIK